MNCRFNNLLIGIRSNGNQELRVVNSIRNTEPGINFAVGVEAASFSVPAEGWGEKIQRKTRAFFRHRPKTSP